MGEENHSVHRASDAAPEPRSHRRGQGLPASDSCCTAYQEVLISADGWSGAWTCCASRRRLAGRRKRSRGALVEILLAVGNRYVRMGDVYPLVEVREFAPGVLQEKRAADGERTA